MCFYSRFLRIKIICPILSVLFYTLLKYMTYYNWSNTTWLKYFLKNNNNYNTKNRKLISLLFLLNSNYVLLRSMNFWCDEHFTLVVVIYLGFHPNVSLLISYIIWNWIIFVYNNFCLFVCLFVFVFFLGINIILRFSCKCH